MTASFPYSRLVCSFGPDIVGDNSFQQPEDVRLEGGTMPPADVQHHWLLYDAALGTSCASAVDVQRSKHTLPQADRRALNITLNSIGTELTRDDRKKLYSNFGLLYPHGQMELAVAEDFDQIRQAMERVPPYHSIFTKVGNDRDYQ